MPPERKDKLKKGGFVKSYLTSFIETDLQRLENEGTFSIATVILSFLHSVTLFDNIIKSSSYYTTFNTVFPIGIKAQLVALPQL